MNKPKVDFTRKCDVECVVLAELGWQTDAIAARLTLSPGQVAYRIRKADASVLRRGYRKGTSDLANKVAGAFVGVRIGHHRPQLEARFQCPR